MGLMDAIEAEKKLNHDVLAKRIGRQVPQEGGYYDGTHYYSIFQVGKQTVEVCGHYWKDAKLPDGPWKDIAALRVPKTPESNP